MLQSFRTARSCKATIGAALVATALLFPFSAGAACQQWNLGGRYEVIQSNGFVVTLNLQQSESNELKGQAYYFGVTKDRRWDKFFGDVKSGTGSVKGNYFTFRIVWPNWAQGVYAGTVNSSGQLKGNTRDTYNAASQATFYTEGVATCVSKG